MKKYLALAMFVVLAVALASPISVLAKTKAGAKPGSFFYFFDKAFEKADLFFTFSPEKKAKKALENAEERLAEAEESASENKPKAVKMAMENYQKNIEVLEKVLIKVPEEAKEAIEKAIEASKERREEMTKKIKEINNEIKKEDDDFKKDEEEKSNDDVGDNESGKEKVENENKDENKKDEQSKEIEKLKKEAETLKQKQPQVKIIEKVEKPVVVEIKQSLSSQAKQKENIITLPNGAVVEMDGKGNIVRIIKEALVNTTIQFFQSTTSSVGKSSSVSNDTPKLNVVVYESDNISQSVQGGVVNFPLVTFRILNPISNEDVRLTKIIFSLSDFAKNVSELNVEIQLPADDFGYSNKFIIGTKKSSPDNFCDLISLDDGKSYVDCKKFDLSKFQNISFNFPETSVIPAGKSVKIKVLGNILPVGGGTCGPNGCGATSISGEYKDFVNLNYCEGNIISNDIPIVCEIGGELVIPNKIYLEKSKYIEENNFICKGGMACP